MVEEKLQEIEQKLERAISNRVQHFKDQANTMTMESVRRLLEKDLDLPQYGLDKYKGLVRQNVEKMMDMNGGDEKHTESDGCKNSHPIKEETPGLPTKLEVDNDQKISVKGGEGTTEDSPVMGVLVPKSELRFEESSLSESMIEKALWERADYLHANSESVTMSGVRRLLEEDLGLQKCMLDPFKKFISQQIDLVLSPSEGSKSAKDLTKNKPNNVKEKGLEKMSRKKSIDSSNKHDNKIDHKEKKREKTPKSITKNFENSKKRKTCEDSDLSVSSKKSNKHVKRLGEESDDPDSAGCVSEDGQSQSFVEKPEQNKEKSAVGYGKRVENLKSIIKACGMSVPPVIYKKAKQVPATKREAFLVKELEGILSKERLSNNPTEKEIKDCRKRKETARELEGIETSNIITSSRRRSTFSFAPPVQLDIQPKKDKSNSKNSKSKSKDTITKLNNDVSEDEDEVKKVEKAEVKKENDEIHNEGKEDEMEEEEKDVDEEEEEEEDDEEDDDDDDEAEESDEFNEDESD